MKISHLTASLLTSTAVFAGILVAQGQSNQVSASSKLRVDYSSNLRQKAGTDAKIIGGLSVGETYNYDKTQEASGYTWYEIGANQWVANAGATAVTGQVKVNYAANKRVGPSTSNKISGGYYPGQVLTFTETAKANGYTWYKVGTNAWVASAGVSEYTAGATASAAAATTSTTAATSTTTTAAATPAASTTTAAPAATTTPAAATTTTTTPAASAATSTTAASTSTPAATTTTKAATPAATTSTATATPTVTAATGRVKTNTASNVRSGAGTSYGVSGSLPAGTIRSYTATATANGYTWYKVGANAWVAGATPYYGTAATTPAASTSTTTATTNTNTNTNANYSSAASTTTSAATTTTTNATASTGSKTSSDSAGNAYAYGQCTWYVKSVAPWAGNHWGNGGQWGASAAAEGFTVNHTPSVGSIVVVAGGQNFGGWTAAAGYGHVAYVVAVNGNSITVQQGGTGFSNPGGPNTQTVSGASNFTYIHR